MNHSNRAGLQRRWHRAAAATAFVSLLAPMPASGAGGDDAPPAALRLNDVQVIGSHNSYRTGIPPEILEYLRKTRRDAGTVFNYSHLPLPQQLDIGIRQIELDVFADPQGGRFVDALGETMSPGGMDRQAFSRPGFKVMHIPGLDYRSSCSSLIACLTQIVQWSDAHPRHLPIFITIDAKDYAFKYPGAIIPLHLTSSLLNGLDDEIRSVVSPSKLITPDEVRGSYPTLRDAVLGDNWPSLEAARGKIMFIFDVRKQTADNYRSGHPSLAGRAMFSLYPEQDPEAATFIVQDPRGNEDLISRLVQSGFIVRTRSDLDTREARNFDFSAFRAASRSGAQMISTDYYPGAPDPQHLGFRISFKHNVLWRCNPVRRPTACALGEE